MKVLVIGANGNTGKRLISRLAKSDHDAIAMIRDPSQKSTFDDLGISTVLADLEYPIDHAVSGCDAIIFAAGSGGHTGKDKTVLVDQLGAIKSMVAAQVHGVRRYIMLSSINNDINSTSAIAHYHKAKAHADFHLTQTELDYTIVCPGGLTNDPPSNRVSISENLFGSGLTSRENLAECLALCLEFPETIGKSFSLLDGETPITNALKQL